MWWSDRQQCYSVISNSTISDEKMEKKKIKTSSFEPDVVLYSVFVIIL